MAGAGRRFRLILVAAGVSTTLMAQAPAGGSTEAEADDFFDGQAEPAGDPLEGFNRAMFRFNDGLFHYALEPVSQGYEFVVPRPLRRGIGNAFANVRYPVRFASSLLQGKVGRATRETGKFAVNTVAGVGGLFNVSDRISALAHVPAEDMGQTLGVWRLPSGPYLVLPLFGSSSPREFVGRVGDFALTPTNWDTLNVGTREWISSDYRTAVQVTGFVSALPAAIRVQDEMKRAALDPYIALREAYLSHRAAEISR